MITKCIHCNTKFKTRDDCKGRKAKCPKCGQPFTIQKFTREVVSELSEISTDVDKNICEVLGLDGLEARDPQENRQQLTSGIYKCYVCRQRCPWDPVVNANYTPICKRCSEQKKLERELRISSRRRAAQKRRVGLIFIGFGLYVLGVALIVFAACWFLHEAGSMTGTTMAYALIAVLAVPCFKFGTDCLRGFV